MLVQTATCGSRIRLHHRIPFDQTILAQYLRSTTGELLVNYCCYQDYQENALSFQFTWTIMIMTMVPIVMMMMNVVAWNCSSSAASRRLWNMWRLKPSLSFFILHDADDDDYGGRVQQNVSRGVFRCVYAYVSAAEIIVLFLRRSLPSPDSWQRQWWWWWYKYKYKYTYTYTYTYKYK